MFHDFNELVPNNPVVNSLSQQNNNKSPHTIDNNNNVPRQIHQLSNAASYELWHQRMGHCGQHALSNLHKHTDEFPQLRGNAFYKFPSCMTRKLFIKQPVGNNKRKNTKQQHVETVSNLSSSDELHDGIHIPNALPG